MHELKLSGRDYAAIAMMIGFLALMIAESVLV